MALRTPFRVKEQGGKKADVYLYYLSYEHIDLWVINHPIPEA